MGSVDAIPLHARLPVWLAAVCLRMPGIVAAGLVERSADGAPRAVACWPEDAQLPVPNDLVAHVFANGGSAWTSDDQGHCIVAHAYEVSERPRGVLVLRVRAGAGDHRRVCDLSAKIASRTWDATMLTPADVSLALAQGMAPPASPVEPVLDPKRAADVVRTVERVRLLDAVPPAPDVPLTPVKNQDTASAAASSMDTNADWAEVVALAAAPLAHADLDAAAFALAQALADRFACDRVSIGMLDGDAVRVLASAPALDFVAARALTQSIASALDECVAQGGVLLHPQNLDAPPRVIAAHAAHARAAGARCVLGVALPGAAMANEEEHVGALCLERLEGEPFRADEIERLQRVAHVLGPMLALHRAARPSRFKRFRSVVAARLAARGVPVGRSLGIVAGVLAAGVFALAFVPTEYRVGAPARVEGVVQRALAAPTDGFLKAVHVRPGDRVKADTPLAELARDDLLLSERKWSGDLAQAQAAYGAALAARDRAQIVIQLAKVEEASAQLALVQAQLARAELRAPFDGVVIEGDLTQSLGAPVKRGDVLMRIAPDGQWRVIVEVDERDIEGIAIGRRGTLVLSAQPGAPIDVRVERITPVATSRDGRTFYEVETKPGPSAEPLRPGMTGIARIEAGRRAYGWIWTHRAVDAVRYAIWRFIG